MKDTMARFNELMQRAWWFETYFEKLPEWEAISTISNDNSLEILNTLAQESEGHRRVVQDILERVDGCEVPENTDEVFFMEFDLAGMSDNEIIAQLQRNELRMKEIYQWVIRQTDLKTLQLFDLELNLKEKMTRLVKDEQDHYDLLEGLKG